MNCLNPRKKKIVDAITGEVKEIVFPCGKCINCLHDFQDMWCTRLVEEGKKYKCVIFDTLTLNPESVKVIWDLTKPDKDGNFERSTVRFAKWKLDAIRKKYSSFHRYFPRFSKEFWIMLRKTGFKVYDFDKKPIQDWLKRGRIAYYRKYGKNADISYFLTKEFGHSTSRPHFHILMYGISLADYTAFFGNPWNLHFGFNKPVFKFYSVNDSADFYDMARYVSKYCLKGSFDTPFVREGIQPNPWRLISKGVGVGYLSRKDFSAFTSPDLQKWFIYHKPSSEVYNRVCEKLEQEGKIDELKDYQDYYKSCCDDVKHALWFKDFKSDSCLFSYLDLSWMTEQDIRKLTVYYDDAGFSHKLPKYYFNKLFKRGNEKNILQFEVQNVLEQSARLHDNKIIQAEALGMGVLIPDIWCERDCSTWELCPSTLFMVLNNHTIIQRRKAQTLAERREIRLKNFYTRSKLNKGAPALQ